MYWQKDNSILFQFKVTVNIQRHFFEKSHLFVSMIYHKKYIFTDMWLILSLKKRVGRVNTGHEVRFCLPDFPRPWRTLEFTRDKKGTWQWRCDDKKNLISVSVLSLFSFNPRKQTRLLRRSEWLKLGNCNWARKVSSGLLTFVNNFRLALFLLRCLSTLSTQTGLDRILKLVVIGIFVLVVPFFFSQFLP